jgi:hypothetical protein
VRAATGTDASRANCHPFADDRHLFMRNGQIGGYGRIRRRVEALIDDRSPALHLRRLDDGVVIASEPYDDARDAWEAVPAERSVSVGPDGVARIERFGPSPRAVAAAVPQEAGGTWLEAGGVRGWLRPRLAASEAGCVRDRRRPRPAAPEAGGA